MLLSRGSCKIVASGDYLLILGALLEFRNAATPSAHCVYIYRAAIATESEVKGTLPRRIRDYQRQTLLACVSVAATDAHFLNSNRPDHRFTGLRIARTNTCATTRDYE